MFNKGEGRQNNRRKPNPNPKPLAERIALKFLEDFEHSTAIRVNLLERSGLKSNRVERDLNLLQGGVNEGARYLKEDQLQNTLDQHFGLDNLEPPKNGKHRADGVTIAALLMMNAAMLHQRIANGRWLSKIKTLEEIQGKTDIVGAIKNQWNTIRGRDFLPVVVPALEAIETICETGKLGGLERALQHIVAEAARIAETYADMGADHAGALFNKVMGDQPSDGAFFTRPTAASLLARIALDAADTKNTMNWKLDKTWKELKTTDISCGSGTLLAAVLADMKRRAHEQGADDERLAELHKLGVENTLKGLDINPVSLQLAATRLTASNYDIKFKRIGLHTMPYGPTEGKHQIVATGTLELLGQSEIVPALRLTEDEDITSEVVALDELDDPEVEDAVEAIQDTKIVIMNPPFTNRTKMGEKFPKPIQIELRERTNSLHNVLKMVDLDMADFGDKNSIEPLFVALADRCLSSTDGVLAIVNPAITLSGPSASDKRRILANRFHIHTILTCHDPNQVNLSESTIHESLIVARRRIGGDECTPTRIISLDRFPTRESEVEELHKIMSQCSEGLMDEGWGEISLWDSARVKDGDWTAGIWRSPELANSGYRFANDVTIKMMEEQGLFPERTDLEEEKGYHKAQKTDINSFPAIVSKGKFGQKFIQGKPDAYYTYKVKTGAGARLIGDEISKDIPVLQKVSHLLVTLGQNAKSARLTAVASNIKYIGGSGWMPVRGVSAKVAKAFAVFYNSTPGRLQLMRNAGTHLAYPTYNPAAHYSIRVPDIENEEIIHTLSECWQATKNMEVPEFGEGECTVRRIWDEAVAGTMGWDPDELEKLRLLLHKEPHVSGRGYGHIRV